MKPINYKVQITPKANAQKMVKHISCPDRQDMFEKMAPKETISAKWIIRNTNSIYDLIAIYELLFSDKAIFNVSGPDTSVIQSILIIAISLSQNQDGNIIFLNKN